MKFMELTDTEIIDIVQPLAEHTENSWNQKDYEAFCRFLIVETTDQKLPEEEFSRQLKENYDVHGKHSIADLVAIHRNPDHVIVIWKVALEKREAPGLLIYGFREHKGEVMIEGCSYHA